MDWIEITVSTNSEGADIVSEALMRQGAVGTQIVDRADVPDPSKPVGYWELIDPNMIEQMPEDVQVKAWFESLEALRADRDGFRNVGCQYAERARAGLGRMLEAVL